MKTLKLKISDELYQRIQKVADQQAESVDQIAIDTIDHHIGNGSLENRQLYGKHISFANFDGQNKLVYVDGIWYRFIIDGHQFVDPKAIYTIVGSDGNLLKLAQVDA